ncbi:MAG: efflux RND transporter periplasmic adaptor subunit [Gammaproteobacteria bacterium]|nr:efflux RND transporter periplasmic adaptor subunit [Gammaproteobacteria bacterium]
MFEFFHALLPAALLLALSACEKPSVNVPSQPEQHPVPVTVAEVRQESLSASHTTTGTLTAAHKIQIFNQEQGRIIRLPYHEGDWVAKGAELVRLDDDVVRAEMTKAGAKRRQAEMNLMRMEKLYSRHAASENEVAQARTALELAQAEEDLQHIILKRTTLSAPFAGVISERLQEPGDIVAQYTHILSLFKPSILGVKIHVSEILLPALKKDDRVEIRIDALGNDPHQGKITRIHPVIDVDTRRGVIELELDPVPRGARPGQLARINFRFQKTTGLVIPFACLHYDSAGAFVYRIEDHSVAHRVTVRTGLQLEDKIEILEGLHEGEQVVLRGLLNMSEGKQVHIVDAQAQQR